MLAWVTSLFNTIKNYTVVVLALIGGVFAALFFYERNKAEVDQALLDEDKMNQQLQKQDDQIKANNDALAAEAQKRKELENEQPPPTNVHDISKWFNSRK